MANFMRRVNRPGLSALGAFFVSAVIVISSVVPSAASAAKPEVTGNNGTLKVHEIGTPSGTESNDPKVCAFNFEGFGFDAGQSGYIMIVGQGLTAGSHGPFSFGPTDGTGYAISQDFNNGGTVIPDGHYKATLYGKDTGGNIDLTDEKAKSKVFKVECAVTEPEPEPGTLIVKKVVVNDNGGTALPENFSFQVDGGTAISFEADGQNDLTVDAGTYDVTEPAVSGYTTTYDNCTDVVIPEGGTATCTVTNDDQPGTLIVKKVVINDNNGEATASDFSFQVNGGTATGFEGDGQNDLTVNAGTYSVTEPEVEDYTTTYENCSNVNIPNGGTATCTITNDDTAPGGGGGGEEECLQGCEEEPECVRDCEEETPGQGGGMTRFPVVALTESAPKVETPTELPRTGLNGLASLLISLIGAAAAYLRSKQTA